MDRVAAEPETYKDRRGIVARAKAARGYEKVDDKSQSFFPPVLGV